MSTSIEWCDETWNPTRGCSRVSSGCDACYAMKMAHRFSAPGGAYEGLTRNTPHGVDWTGVVRLVPEALDAPLRWRRPMRIFVNSMSDLFHESLPAEDVADIFGVMAVAGTAMRPYPPAPFYGPRGTGKYGPHAFQVLTKRPKRMLELLSSSRFREDVSRAAYRWAHDRRDAGYLSHCISARRCTGYDAPVGSEGKSWPLTNVWLGVSVENEEAAEARIPILLNTPAAVRFVSYEPALEAVDFSRYLPGNCSSCGDENDEHGGCAQCEWITDSPGIDWLIVGGESGPGARSFDVSWARSAVEQCKAAGVACFVKQLGARPIDKRWQEGAISFSEGPRLKSKKGGDPSEWPEDLRVREFPGVRP